MDKRVFITTVVVILGWWGISMMRYLASNDGAFKTPTEDPVVTATRPKATLPTTMKGAGGPTPAPGPSAAGPRNLAPASVPFEYQTQLNEFAALKAKVLPSKEESLKMKRLLTDVGFLRGVGVRLARLPLLPLGEQDVAIDLLIEALKTGDKGTAQEVLGSIVSDKQVENVKLEREVREQLAGIKGEVLYHWAAIMPDEARRIIASLPGPVSRKIWRNVEDTHENNLAESRLMDR